MIAIVDTGLDGVLEFYKWASTSGHEVRITADQKDFARARQIILYSTASFGETMRTLHELGLVAQLKKLSIIGKPILGIGTGMHVFFTSGDEGGFHQGLNLFPGRAVARNNVEGSSSVSFRYAHPLIRGLIEGEGYFSQSFFIEAENEEDILAESGENVVAIVGRRNTLGVQFYPERSGEWAKELRRCLLKTDSK